MSQLLIDGAMPDAASLAGILANINATIANITNVKGTIAATQVAFGAGSNTIAGDPALTWSNASLSAQLSIIPATNVNATLQMTAGGTAGCAFSMSDGLGNSAGIVAAAGGGFTSQSANGNFWQVDIDAGSMALSGTGVSVLVDPSGTGFVDAAAYKAGGTPGLASFSGAVTNITVKHGIVTAAS